MHVLFMDDFFGLIDPPTSIGDFDYDDGNMHVNSQQGENGVGRPAAYGMTSMCFLVVA
jgi:hypothetical protein